MNQNYCPDVAVTFLLCFVFFLHMVVKIFFAFGLKITDTASSFVITALKVICQTHKVYRYSPHTYSNGELLFNVALYKYMTKCKK